MTPQHNGHARTNGAAASAATRARSVEPAAGPSRLAAIEAVRRRGGGLWPGMIFGLLGLNGVIVGITIYAATSDRSFAIEPGYYDKATHWDEHMAARRASDQLGWSVAVRLDGGDPASPSLPTIAIALTDRGGAAVDGAALSAEMFHNARSRDRFALRFSERGSGTYEAVSPVDRMGVWQVRLTARRGDAVFTCERSLHVGAGSAEARP